MTTWEWAILYRHLHVRLVVQQWCWIQPLSGGHVPQCCEQPTSTHTTLRVLSFLLHMCHMGNFQPAAGRGAFIHIRFITQIRGSDTHFHGTMITCWVQGQENTMLKKQQHNLLKFGLHFHKIRGDSLKSYSLHFSKIWEKTKLKFYLYSSLTWD